MIMSPRASPEPGVKQSTKTAFISTRPLLTQVRESMDSVKWEPPKVVWDETARAKKQEPFSDSKEELEFLIQK